MLQQQQQQQQKPPPSYLRHIPPSLPPPPPPPPSATQTSKKKKILHRRTPPHSLLHSSSSVVSAAEPSSSSPSYSNKKFVKFILKAPSHSPPHSPSSSPSPSPSPSTSRSSSPSASPSPSASVPHRQKHRQHPTEQRNHPQHQRFLQNSNAQIKLPSHPQQPRHFDRSHPILPKKLLRPHSHQQNQKANQKQKQVEQISVSTTSRYRHDDDEEEAEEGENEEGEGEGEDKEEAAAEMEEEEDEEETQKINLEHSKRREQVDLDLQRSCSPRLKRQKVYHDLRPQGQGVDVASSSSGNCPKFLVKPNFSHQTAPLLVKKLPQKPDSNQGLHGSSNEALPPRSRHDNIPKGQSPPSFSAAAASSAIFELQESQKPSKKRKLRSSAVESASFESSHSLTQYMASTSALPPPEEEEEEEEASLRPYPESEASKDSAAVTLSPKVNLYRDDDDGDDGGDEHDGVQKLVPAKHLLKSVLDRLQKKDKFGAFAEPVDPKEVPNYCDFIKIPMDFATMRKRIASGYYTTLDHFERDIFTICDNAMTYNAKGTVYFRHARAIKDVAERILEELRMSRPSIELDEMLSKQRSAGSVSIKKPHKKQFSMRLIHEDATEDIALGNKQTGDLDGDTSISALPESSVQNVEPSFYTESPSEPRDNNQEDTSGYFLRSVGRSPAFYENRRNTYVTSITSAQELDPLVTTISGESLQIVPTGHQLDFPYARSLARFAAELGPIVWKVASKQIEAALPHGYLFGPGWVGEREAPVVTSSPVSKQQKQLQPNYETMDKVADESVRSSIPVVNQESCIKLAEHAHTQSIDMQVPNENQAPICRGGSGKHNNRSKKHSNVSSIDSSKQVQPPSAQHIERMENRDLLPTVSSTNFLAKHDSSLMNVHHPHTQSGALVLPNESQTAIVMNNAHQSYIQCDPQTMAKMPHENPSMNNERSWKVDLQSNAQTMGKRLHEHLIDNQPNLNKLDYNSSSLSSLSNVQTLPRVSHENRHLLANAGSGSVDHESRKNSTGQKILNLSNVHVPFDPTLMKSSQQPHLHSDSQRTVNLSSSYERPAVTLKSLDNDNEFQKGTNNTSMSGTTMNLNHPAPDNAMLFGNRVSVRDDNPMKSKDSVLTIENPSKLSTSESMPAMLSTTAIPSTSPACFPFMGKFLDRSSFLRTTDLQMENADKSCNGRNLDINCNATVLKGASLNQSESQAAYSVARENYSNGTESGTGTPNVPSNMNTYMAKSIQSIQMENASKPLCGRNLDMNCNAAIMKGTSLNQPESQTTYSGSRENYLTANESGKGSPNVPPHMKSYNIANSIQSTQIENASKTFNGRNLDVNCNAAIVKGASLRQSESQSAYSVNREKYLTASENSKTSSNLLPNTKNHSTSTSIQPPHMENASNPFSGRNLDVNSNAAAMKGASLNQYESQAVHSINRENYSNAIESGKSSSNGLQNTKNYSINNSIQSTQMETGNKSFNGRNLDVNCNAAVMKGGSLNQSESQSAYLINRENYFNASESGEVSLNGQRNAKNYTISNSIQSAQTENANNSFDGRNLDVNGNAAVMKDPSLNQTESQGAYLINRENCLNVCETGKGRSNGPPNVKNYKISNSGQLAQGSMLAHNLNVPSPRSSVAGSKDTKTVESFPLGGNREINSVESAQTNTLLQYNHFNSVQDANSNGVRMKNNTSHHHNALQSAPAAMLSHSLNSPVQHSFISSQMSTREVNLFAEKGLNARSNFMLQGPNLNNAENSQERNHPNHTKSILQQHEQSSEKQNVIVGSPSASFSSVFSNSNGVSRFKEDQRMPGSMPIQQPDSNCNAAMKNQSQLVSRSSEMQSTQHAGRFQANGNQKHYIPNVPHFLQKHLSKSSSDSPGQNQQAQMQMQSNSGTHYMRPSESWSPNLVMQKQAAGHFLPSGVSQAVNPAVWQQYAEPRGTSSQGSVSFSGAPDLNVSLSHTKSPYDQSSGNEIQQPDLALQL